MHLEHGGTIMEKQGLFPKLVSALYLPVLGIILALLVGAVLMLLLQVNPVLAYGTLIKGSLGSRYAIAETLTRATPVLFTGLAYAFAYRCGLSNIGAEGQFYVGGLTATMAALVLPPMPMVLHLPITLLAGFVGGGIWCAIPGWLKTWKGISETITTIMFVYIGQYLVGYMVTGPLKEPGYFPQSAPIPASAKLPIMLSGTRLSFGFLLALFCALLFYLVLFRSSLGFRVRVVGSNIGAARYIGLNIKRTTIFAMLVSGGLAGLGGATEIIGVQGRLLDLFSPGYGWDGITVGLLGRTHPLGIIFAALFIGMLRSGGSVMQRALGVPVALIYALQAVIIIVIVVSTYVERKRPSVSYSKTAVKFSGEEAKADV